MRATTHGLRVAASSSLRAFVPVAGGSLLRTAARTLPLATCARFASTLCAGVVRPTLLAARTTSNTMRRAAHTAVRTHGLGHRGQAVAVHSYSGWSVRTWHRPFSSTSALRSNASSPAATHGQADTVASVGTDETDPDGLIPILIRIQEIVKDDMEFPRFVVLGNQSAGKTSALEALVGMDILPKGQDMVTRRPLEVSMMRTGSGQWVEFDDGEKYYDFEAVKTRIRDENLSINGVTNDPLRIKVFAPHFHNLTLVDLPGYINAVKPPMPRTVPKQISDMIDPYIEDDRNIMLVVCSATEDLANSMGLAKAQQADKSGRRSMGVVTKCDLPKYKHTLIETLQNRNFPLGLGYVGVRCRTQTELEAGMGFDELVLKEADFFDKSELTNTPGVRTGLPLLRKELSITLLRKVGDELPRILAKLDAKIEEARRNENFLDTLSKEPNLKTVSRELESLVNQLHPAADSRRSFEEKLRSDLHDLLHKLWSDATQNEFDFKGSQVVIESEYQVDNVRAEANRLLTKLDVESAAEIDYMNQFNGMMIHGVSPLKDTADSALHAFKRRALAQGALSAYYRPAFPNEPQRAHRKWNRELQAAVDNVIEQQDGVSQCFQLLLDSLREFSDSAETNKADPAKVNLARLFFRYLLEKIAARIQEEGLEETIVGMLDREKRPAAEYGQVIAQLAGARNHPESLPYFFSDLNKQLRVPMYGRDWTEAYMNVVSARTADDIFRILSVRMLEPLIFECISYSLNMFRADKIVKEADKQTAYLRELERYRDIIAAAAERYHSDTTVNL